MIVFLKDLTSIPITDFLVTLASDDGTIKELDEEVFINSIRPKKDEIEFTFSFQMILKLLQINNLK